MKLFTGWESLLPVTDTTITAVNFGVETNPNHHLGPLVKVEHTLQYMISGQGSYNLNGKTFTVRKCDMFYLPKGQSVEYWTNKSNPYVYYYVSIDGPIVKMLMEKIGFSLQNPVIRYEESLLMPIFKNMENALQLSSLTSIIQYKSYMYNLIATLLSCVKKNNVTLQGKHDNEYINLAVNYVEQNYHSDITVSSMAKALGLCRSYLTALFKKYLGVAPIDYIIKHRILQAKYLLEQKISVTEVAMRCGFNSLSNFSVQFKKIIGRPPRDFIPKD